jgi:2-methylisocitrate lyase-like PEP mutase family enzyme
VVGSPGYTLAELEEAGVRRVSVGGGFCRAALAATKRAAEELLATGTFEWARGIPGTGDFNKIMAG